MLKSKDEDELKKNIESLSTSRFSFKIHLEAEQVDDNNTMDESEVADTVDTLIFECVDSSNEYKLRPMTNIKRCNWCRRVEDEMINGEIEVVRSILE